MFPIADGDSEQTGSGHQTWSWLHSSNILETVN